jgi:hypothetical protein
MINGGVRGILNAPSITNSGGVWTLSQQQQYLSASLWQPPLPDISGLVGLYNAETFTGSSWLDASGNSNHASVGGSPTISTSSNSFGASRTFRVLQGTPADSIIFPTQILPTNYTMFYVARYNTSNSDTAPTQLIYRDGSSTSQAITPGTGGGSSSTSINGEVRVTYSSFETVDGIWGGLYNFIDNASPAITSNAEYLLTIEGRSDNAFLTNGSHTFGQSWDSSVYSFQEGSTPVMSTDRRMSSHKFASGSSFSLGNRWMRGINKTNFPYSSTTYAYFRNMALYRVPQRNLHQIFTGQDRIWYSGFYAGMSGVGYHGNRLNTTNIHSNNWVLGTDSNSGGNGTLLRTNRVDRYNSSLPANSGATTARLAVNPTAADGSNFQIAEVIVYNRALTSNEYNQLEVYLANKYGIS